MRRQHHVLALLTTISLVAAACGGDDDDGGAGAGSDTEQRTGGELVLGAEQWAECLNPITQCSNASWLTWTVLAHVLPRLMEVQPDGTFAPTAVLDGEPVLSGEGTDNSEGPFTVTYTIAEDAVWEDGTPITSSDIRFTWEARMATTGVLNTYGYELIENVDDSDEKTAVVTFTEPFADWQDIFGGGTEFFLKEAAFEEGQLDLADEMQTEIPFSGGPFVLDAWSPEELTLVPNENYWDEERRPLVDEVTMIPFEDTDAEITALRSGQVMALFPQPSPGLTEELADLEYVVGFGATYESIWLNLSSRLNPDSVLKDPAVREALLYAIDREALLEEVVQPDIPETELLQCAAWVPNIGDWCDPTDFEDVSYDPDRVAEILEDAGWERGDDGIYVKDGQRLSLTWQTVADNQRRLDIQSLVIPQLQELGIEVTADNYDGGTLFEQRLPQLQSEMMLYAQTASPDPSVTAILSCENVPSEENDFSGQNLNGWCHEEATELMHQADRTPIPEERLDLIHQIGDIIREEAVLLPLWQLPRITAWDPAAVSGPIGEYNTTPQSGFANIYDWSVN